ncbi:MAG: hypothetical protein ACYTAQ_05725 [Planctomycetota bacterium]
MSASGQCPEGAKLLAPDAAVDDLFGWSVAVSGGIAVVGAPEKDDSIGAAYICRFDPDTSQWIEEATLLPEADDPSAFGRSVAVSSDVALIGAPAVAGGRVYVYRYDPAPGQWLQEAILEASDGQQGDQFGWSVAIDDDVAIIATYGPGSAYVFRFDADASAWVEEARLTASDGAPLRESVGISGDVAVAGTRTGWSAAFVYRYAPGEPAASGSPWVEEARLEPWDMDYLDYFGNAVAVNGDRVIVGAGGDIPTFDPGAAYVYRYDPSVSAWVRDTKLLASDVSMSGHFGHAVAIDGTGAVVGEIYDETDGTDAGSAYVFRREPGGWFEQARLVPSDAEDDDHFGRSVALSGEIAIVGASEWLQDTGTGSAYVFDISDTDCNNNGITDACEILAGTAPDNNGNGRPDECDADPGQYIGPDGGSWFDPSHWNSGSVPDGTVHATIPAHAVIDQPGAQAATVTLTSSGGLSFLSGSLATGSLDVTAGGVVEGSGTIQGEVVNAGAIDPGVLSIEGNYEQTAQGTLRIELGSSPSPPVHDVLAVGGAATLGGTLIVELAQPHDALFGEVFEIVTCGSRSGWFAQMSQPVLPAPLGWNVEVLPTAIRIDFSAAFCDIQKVVAPDADQYDYAGRPLALSGNVAVVAGAGGSVLGPVRVYRFDPQVSRWLYEAFLEPSTGGSFGTSVAISGDIILVGTRSAYGFSGAAYVFSRAPGASAWVEEDILVPSDGASHDQFGASVAIVDDRALIGAPHHDDLGLDSGAAYVFERDPGTLQWAERAKLLPSDGGYGDHFGACVALGEDVAVVGSTVPHDLQRAGSAYVFRRDPDSSQWTEEAKLLPSTSVSGDQFGSAVAMDGSTIVVGTQPDFWDGPLNAEAAFIFRYESNVPGWIEQARLVAPDASFRDMFGQAVAIDGNVLVVGARYARTGDVWAGALYVYRFDPLAAAWIWRAKVIPEGAVYGGHVGASLGLEGTTLLAGAPADDDAGPGAGAVYVLDVSGPCPGDVDGDGHVGVGDFLDLLLAWGPCPDPPEPCPADFDGDGVVGVIDFLLLLANWTEPP